ncbi:PTS glucose transporter subunit IIA [Virgibacillus sp. Bac332]|uniref:PTS sugar transporter subunit IIA n=1 Tax=Virgibacillus sp. Bac332 TaxID=2419842 RepID=UPI000EF55985|nr:PTS glucose transporter subunit IIA [Virgibacillus sp. Bac332]
MSSQLKLVAPTDGNLIKLADVPDPVFSEKMIGDGVAIKPSNGILVSPVDAKVIQVFPTKHAIGLKSVNNIEILIHIGLETVSLKGEGFKVFVKEGDNVQLGEKLISFDVDLIKEKAASAITPIIITNTADMQRISQMESRFVSAGKDEILSIEKQG